MRDGRDIRNEWTGLGPAAVTGRVRRMLADVVTANAAELEQRERRRHEHERQIRQWQKEQEEREREHQQREQERTRRWETAMATATEQAVAAIRHDIFRSAFTSWTRAAEIRRFCTVLEECGSSRGDLANWVAWGRAEADRIDPVVEEPSLADVSFDIAPTSNDLREFFDGWSSHRPDKENNRDRASAVSRRPSIEWLRRAARA